jgi:hypothetical protein
MLEKKATDETEALSDPNKKVVFTFMNDVKMAGYKTMLINTLKELKIICLRLST